MTVNINDECGMWSSGELADVATTLLSHTNGPDSVIIAAFDTLIHPSTFFRPGVVLSLTAHDVVALVPAFTAFNIISLQIIVVY